MSAHAEISWDQVLALPRRSMEALDLAAVPRTPGVFVVFREGHPVYVGRAVRLDATLARALTTTVVATIQSPLRRVAAGFIGIASAASIVAGRYHPLEEDAIRVSQWIRAREVAWQTCASESEAVTLEARLRVAQPEAARQALGAGARS